jgi:hypothetical protein
MLINLGQRDKPHPALTISLREMRLTMPDQQDDAEQLSALFDGLRTDATMYFDKARGIVGEIDDEDVHWRRFAGSNDRDEFWAKLPEEIRGEAKRLDRRLISLMGQVARAVRNGPLASEADQRDVMTGTKTMRAALLLREFRSWDAEILNNEDVVLGVTPAGQADDRLAAPKEAARSFADWAEKIAALLDLVAGSPALGPVTGREATEAARYRLGTAFIMMWMDKSQPDLTDVSDAVKEVFSQFDVRAVRADDIEHEDLITSRILNEIKTAEFCFADLTGGRPNVYYEVGYAHALGRRVILFRKAGTGLHFDLAGYNCPEYQNLRDLKEKLTQRLQAMTNKAPKT